MRTKLIFLFAVLFTLQLILAMSMANALTISSVDVYPNEIAPNGKIEVRINLDNNLGDNIEDVSISLELSKVPFAPEKTSEIYFDEIRKDKSKEAIFELVADANAEPLTYKIPITISYKHDNQTKIRSSYFSIKLHAKPKLDFSISSFVLKNQKNKIQIQITNTGLAKASFMEIEIGQGNFVLLSGNKIYVGDLDSNDFDTISFEAYVRDTGIINIPLTIKYKDPSNKEYEQSQSLTIKAYSQKEAENLGLVKKGNTKSYFIIVIIIIIIILFIRWRRKRARNKQNQV